MSWDRLLWGVQYVHQNDKPLLISTGWDDRPTGTPDTEPTRALLFRTRQQAQDWCRTENKTSRMLGRVRPVRVRERVDVVEKERKA